MSLLTQSEVFSLIADLNAFADRAETTIIQARSRYDQNKQSLAKKHTSVLAQLEASYKANCNSISSKSKQTISEARRILSEVEALDSRLTQVDKYYLKTKRNKEAELANTTSDQFNEVTDYFSILDDIKGQYATISRKYSEDILPALINGLNFFFSSKRKKDYEELIVLLNTIRSFVNEIEKELPPITNESLSYQKDAYFSKRKEIIAQNNAEVTLLETNYKTTIDAIADRICSDLDTIMPDELTDYIAEVLSGYEATYLKVNAGSGIESGILSMFFVDYPVDFFVQSPIVASLIKDKCSPILAGQSIRFPIITSTQDAPAWQINDGGQDNSHARFLSHAIMFSFLSACPVSKLTFAVMDPENRGTSVAPYYDAKKKLQDLFDEGFSITRDEISQRINSLTQYVEYVLQEKLGTEFENIYSYADANESYEIEPILLVVYDFPKGFDEQSLSGLKNIIKNGSRCGVYTIIIPAHQEDTGRIQNDIAKGLKAIEGLTSIIQCTENSYVLRGMPLLFNPMPDKNEFIQFFGKYMLLFEGIKNRGIAFSPQIKKLVDAKNEDELSEQILYLKNMLSTYEKQYFSVPDIDTTFPTGITLGTVLYPADIFSESVGFDTIRKSFCADGKVTLFNQVKLPLSMNLNSSFNMLLYSSEQTAEIIREFTHHIMWDLLSFLPVTKANFSVVDVENRNSIKPFSDLRKALPELFNVVTSHDKIHEMLQQINLLIDDFTQNKLGSRFENILEYNLNAPRRAESITLLLIYDFPKGFDSRSIDTLLSILKNGNRCGIYTLICYDPEIKFSRYESIDDSLEQIQKNSIVAEFKDGSYQLMPFGLPVSIPDKKEPDTISAFVKEYAEKANEIKHRGISFNDILPTELFSRKSSTNLEIPIGIGDGDAVVNLVFGEGTSHHCLIGGGTGGGKSTLLHTIIMSGMLNYSPDQLHLYLMDFKGGTEFKVYESARLPHINLLALDAMQEFGESILENIVQEMENRSVEFKESGGYTKIQDYIEGTGKSMPRILIIMDEFQILFNDSTNRKVAMNCANLAKRIVTEGRAYGIHLMMATQSTNIISTLTLDRGTIEQMRVRIGLKCGEADTRYLFSDLYCNDAKNKMMGPKGTAVLNEDYTETPENNDTSLKLGNIGLRVAYCTDALKETYLKVVSEEFIEEDCVTQIFEGGRTKSLIDYLTEINVSKTNQQPVYVHMGEKIKVAPPFSITLDRKRKHNILICGTNTSMTDNILNDYMISVLLNESSTVYCIDGDVLVGDGASEEFYGVLSEKTGRFHAASSRADIVMFIHEIYEEYQRRKRTSEKSTICVVIKNLQYTDIIKAMFKGERIDEREYLESEEELVEAEEQQQVENVEPDPMDIFAAFNSVVASRNAKKEERSVKVSSSGYSNDKILKLIDDGSGFGIHFVVTSSDYQTVKETMRFGENILAKFPERFVFSLSNTDADNLVEGVSVASLNSNIVYYTDGVRETFQLKPYIAPSPAATAAYFDSISD